MSAWTWDENDPPFRRGGGYQPAVARAICRRIARGESVRRICAAADMPSAQTLYSWSRDIPEFGEMHRAALRAARNAERDWREAQADARAWKPPRRPGRPTGYTPARGEAFCRALAEGRSLGQVCARPGMPSPVTVYNWLHRHEDFARGYALARELQTHRLVDLADEIVAGVTPETEPVARLRFAALKDRARRLAPWKFGAAQGSLPEPPRRIEVRYETVRVGTAGPRS